LSRNRMRSVIPIVAVSAGFLLVSHSTAHAYIDPGTGGMLLQLLLGGIAGSLVIIKLYWHRLRQAVGRLFGGATKTEKADTD